MCTCSVIEMNVKVLFKGPISVVTGEEINVKLPDRSRISDLIDFLRRNYGEIAEKKGLGVVFRDFVAQNIVLINNRDLSVLNGLNTMLKPGDVIKVINFTHGG